MCDKGTYPADPDKKVYSSVPKEVEDMVVVYKENDQVIFYGYYK